MNANTKQKFRSFWAAALAGLLALAVPIEGARAQAAPPSTPVASRFIPGMYGALAPHTSPAQAAAKEAAIDRASPPQRTVSTFALAAPVQGPGSVVELARALKNDADLIYEYVYNNIDFVPVYGQLKGALGTILDQKGDSFDQAFLMASLLQQAGYTVNIVQGVIGLNQTQVINWLGVANDGFAINTAANILAQGGVPVSIVGSTVQLTHFWVQVTIGGTNYVFDPSFKSYTYTTGINLATATGYNQTSLLSSAGGTIGTSPPSIKSINSTNLASTLASYSNNLLSYIRSNIPTAQLNDVVGGHSINPLTGTPLRQTSLPYQVSVTRTFAVSAVPTSLRTTLQVSLPGFTSPAYFTDQIYGQRLTITYTGTTSLTPVFTLNGTVQGSATAVAANSTQTLSVTITHNAVTFASQSGTQGILACSACTYLIVNGWGASSHGMVDYHKTLLGQNQAVSGATSGSEPVLGEALAVMAHSWIAEVTQSNYVADQLANTSTSLMHSVGLVGYKVSGSSSGTFTDIAFQFSAVWARFNDPSPSFPAFFRQFYIETGHDSAFEYGAIQQNIATDAVSTVKLFDIANTAGTKIYDANSTANYNLIKPNLTGYSTADKNTNFPNLVAAGHRLLLPANGAIMVGTTYTGDAYVDINQSSGGIGIAYVAAGGLKGSTGDLVIIQSDVVNGTSPDTPNTAVTPTYVWGLGANVNLASTGIGNDPTNLFTGDYLHKHTDLSVGSVSFPYGLALERSYNSGRRLINGPLGLGWTHNFLVSAQPGSDGFQGLGQDSGISAASSIAGIYVTLQLTTLQSGETQIPLQRLAVATLGQRWFMDQLIGNSVLVSQPNASEQFIKLTDGTYNPPPASSDRLTLTGGLYTLTSKDGVKLNFNSANNLSTWVSPAGVTVTLAYGGTPLQLTSVSNGIGRQLNFTYDATTHTRLTKVDDNNGTSVRTAQYSVNTSTNNLDSYTDANSKTTNYTYDIPGRLTQIQYPSFPTPAVTNTYDSLGRIQTQANGNNAPGNNTTWTYFFAGYRSEEVDPNGTRHVVYNNPRGKVLQDIQDLAGLDRVTTTTYDGLDRPTSITAPEGNSVSYTYITATNPWANNIGTIVQTPKSGSGLSALTTTYAYDATFNKPTSITDPKSIVTTMSYSPTTGTLTNVIKDVGTGHLNAQTSYTYNTRGQVLTVTTEVTPTTNTVTQYNYDTLTEKLTSVVGDPGTSPHLNITNSLGYDAAGNVTTVTDPNNHTTTIGYDAMRRVSSVTAPITGISTTYTRDADGRVTQISNQNGSTPQLVNATYSVTGKTLTVTDPNSHVTTYTYDLLDRLATVTDAESRLTTNAYDTLSRLSSVTNTAIQSTPLLQESYSPNGRLASLTDALGHATSFAYDGLDRPSTTTYPGGSTEVLGYDNDSNVTSFTNRVGSLIQYGYDNLNRLTSKTPPTPAPVVTYSYDLANRLTGVSDTSSAIPTVAVPGGGSGVQYTSYFYYDQINRLTGTVFDSVNAVTAPAASSVAFNHWYNKVNQRSYQTVNDNGYWAYPAAAASTVSYSANNLNQYTAVGSVTPSYDGNGNLTGDGTFTYGYDAENRLTSAAGAGNTAAYSYDASGRRKSKTVNGTSTYYLSDGDREVLEYDGSGNVLRRYTHGDGIDEVLNLVNVSGSRSLLVPDIQGSLIASVDSTSGTITKQGNLAYGESTDTSGSFRYTGRRIDAETLGLYYYRARMYHPTLGRFMQPDPIGYAGGANLYAYVGNDPLNRIDPLGLCDQQGGCSGSGFTVTHPSAADMLVSHGEGIVQSALNFVFSNFTAAGYDMDVAPPQLFSSPPSLLGYSEGLATGQGVVTIASGILAGRSGGGATLALPEFNRSTAGLLFTNEGETILLESGGADFAFSNYPAASHVEGKAAIWIRENGSSGGIVFHNNPGGTCGMCNSNIPTLLPNGATLEVVPPPNAVAPNKTWIDTAKTYIGNSAQPKLR